LYEHRRELLNFTSLAGFISQPDWGEGTFIPVHNGAQQFYDREKPSFFTQNGSILSFSLSLLVVLISALISFRNKFLAKQKDRADVFTNELLGIKDQIKEVININEINSLKNRMMKILENVVNELDEDRISNDGFQVFSFTWKVIYEIISEKERELKT